MIYQGNNLKEISFPLGGIGTGSIGLGGDGRLIDWEIFNRPSKGSINDYSNFSVRTIQDGKITAAVLNGDYIRNYTGQYRNAEPSGFLGFGKGQDCRSMAGFPHFKDVQFDGQFPMASILFKDENFPADITMRAFNPFIPHDAFNSSIPAAFFEIEAQNNTDKEMIFQIAFSVTNPSKSSHNNYVKKDGFKIINLNNDAVYKDDIDYKELSIATDSDNVYTQSYWYRGEWQDRIVTFWNDFSTKEVINERVYNTTGDFDTATIIAGINIPPKKHNCVRFVLTWNAPNNYYHLAEKDDVEGLKPWKNYYATVFNSSEQTAIYSLKNWDMLYNRTLNFKNELHTSTLPKEVIDAASSNLSVLKSPTVLRLEDGSFWGWEGVDEKYGLCYGTCQHVWNYAYAMCFLFPELERSIRNNEFKYNLDKNGRMQFRTKLPLDTNPTNFRACVDGQMGAVIKCYREWKISGDNEWLASNWENIKSALEYAWSDNNQDKWDLDKDGVLEGRQHHTLDMELFGPSSWLEGMYLAALKAASEMAEFLGDNEKAQEYKDIFNKGYEWTKENLFNGKYFIQKIDLTDKSITDKFNASDSYWNSEKEQIKYQVSEGSAIDQLLAQWHADIIGLGDIFDEKQIETALSHMMKNNFKPNMRYFANPWRVFSVNDECGAIICDYENCDNKPAIPLPYSEETMTGFEYAFAGLQYSRGKKDDGLRIVQAIRYRYDGEKRNPWNEIECGSNYARSMASFSLIPILSGFEFDMPHHYIGFNPYVKNEFKCIWSVANSWGNFEINGNQVKINVFEGEIPLESVGLNFCDHITNLKIDGKNMKFNFKNGKLFFEKTNVLNCVEITI